MTGRRCPLLWAITLVATIGVAFSGPESASAQVVRLSWDTCDPQRADTVFSAAGVYRLVVSAKGIAQSIIGHDSEISIGPVLQDAWRFDEGGCQGSEGLSVSSASLSKSCPSLKGTNSAAITNYSYDLATGYASLRLALTYDAFTPAAGTRYTMWQLAFDHGVSAAGTDLDSSTCNNAGPPFGYDISIESSALLASGQYLPLQMDSTDSPCTWNGGPPGGENLTIFPSTGWVGRTVDYYITGSNFRAPLSVSLIRASGTILTGSVLNADARHAEARFTFAAKDTGRWSMVIRNAGGESTVKGDAVHVVALAPKGLSHRALGTRLTIRVREGMLPLTGPRPVSTTAINGADPGLMQELNRCGALTVQCLWPDMTPQPTEAAQPDGSTQPLWDFGRCYELTFSSAEAVTSAITQLRGVPGIDYVRASGHGRGMAMQVSCPVSAIGSCVFASEPNDASYQRATGSEPYSQWYLNHTDDDGGTLHEDIRGWLCMEHGKRARQ